MYPVTLLDEIFQVQSSSWCWDDVRCYKSVKSSSDGVQTLTFDAISLQVERLMETGGLDDDCFDQKMGR